MPIRITKTDLPAKPLRDVEKTDAASSSAKSTPAVRPSPSADRVQIETGKFSDDLSFARSILAKNTQKQLESLPEIKSRIKRGFYDTDTVREKTALSVSRDLGDPVTSAGKSSAQKPAVPLTAERKHFLTQDDQVADRVANRIRKDLENL